MQQSQIKYCELLSARTKTTYLSFGKVFCPILNKTIVFNSKGFHHLHYKSDGTARKIPEKIHKLRLVPLAIPVIKNAIEIYGERTIKMARSRKKGKAKIMAKQYALEAIVGRKKPIKVRVIILETENSENPIFWSIMRH